MKRSLVAISLIALLSLPVARTFAGPNDATQLAAARRNAVTSLRVQVDSIRLTEKLTVSDFIAQTRAVDLIADLESKARALGGPRWVDDQTVQVKLELSGADLVGQLVAIAMTHPDGPISPGLLERRLKSIRSVSLIGTGTSTSGPADVRPPGVSDAWAAVSQEQRNAVLALARTDAADQLLHDVASLPLAAGRTAGDLLQREAVSQSVRDWLDTRPTTDVRYTDDLGVQLTLSASQVDLIDRIVAAAGNAGASVDAQQVESINQKFAQKTLVAVGHATVAVAAAVPPANAGVLPETPPTWTAQPIDAQGVSVKQRTPLQTKLAAEADATEALRAQVRTLRLGGSRTIGDAAGSDPRIESAIAAALLRAHVYRSDSRPDGSWRVRITLDTRDLWDELSQAVGQ